MVKLMNIVNRTAKAALVCVLTLLCMLEPVEVFASSEEAPIRHISISDEQTQVNPNNRANEEPEVLAYNPVTVTRQTEYPVTKDYDTNYHHLSFYHTRPSLQTVVSEDGTISVCSIGSNSDVLFIREYTSDMSFIRTLVIKKELEMTGAFTKDAEGNFYIFFAEDVDEGDFEVINQMLVKYNSSGEIENVFSLIAKADDSSYGVIYPFDAGSCRIEIAGDWIAVYYAREMFQTVK